MHCCRSPTEQAGLASESSRLVSTEQPRTFHSEQTGARLVSTQHTLVSTDQP